MSAPNLSDALDRAHTEALNNMARAAFEAGFKAAERGQSLQDAMQWLEREILGDGK